MFNWKFLNRSLKKKSGKMFYTSTFYVEKYKSILTGGLPVLHKCYFFLHGRNFMFINFFP
jgi:hypothetical protein